LAGDDGRISATLHFSIDANGGPTNIETRQPSGDAAYDESLKRALRSAATFPAPPEDCRAYLSRGIDLTFKLGDLRSLSP
jgi:TonB family protein